MLVVKNKNNSLLWELNYFFYFFREKYCILPPTWPPCHVVANQGYTIMHLVRLIRTPKVDFYPIKNVLEAKINTVIILEINLDR